MYSIKFVVHAGSFTTGKYPFWSRWTVTSHWKDCAIPSLISRILRCVCSLVSAVNVRIVPDKVASSAITLQAVPAWKVPKVTTAPTTGSTFRLTIVCACWIKLVAAKTISFAWCGKAACPPFPFKVMFTSQVAANNVPTLVLIVPTGKSGLTWSA